MVTRTNRRAEPQLDGATSPYPAATARTTALAADGRPFTYPTGKVRLTADKNIRQAVGFDHTVYELPAGTVVDVAVPAAPRPVGYRTFAWDGRWCGGSASSLVPVEAEADQPAA